MMNKNWMRDGECKKHSLPSVVWKTYCSCLFKPIRKKIWITKGGSICLTIKSKSYYKKKMQNRYYIKVIYKHRSINYRMSDGLGITLSSNTYFASLNNNIFRLFHGTHKISQIRKAPQWQENLLAYFPQWLGKSWCKCNPTSRHRPSDTHTAFKIHIRQTSWIQNSWEWDIFFRWMLVRIFKNKL